MDAETRMGGGAGPALLMRSHESSRLHSSQDTQLTQKTEPRKNTRGPLLSIESWMVNRDPYFMVYENNPYITG